MADLVHVTKDGRRIAVEVSCSLFQFQGQSTVSVIVRDITKRKQAERALVESERKYRLVVEKLSAGIWVVDKGRSTVFVNPAMAEMLRYAVEDMIGKPPSFFMDKRGGKTCQRYWKPHLQGAWKGQEMEFVRKDGTRFHASLKVPSVSDGYGNYAGR